MPSYKFTYFDGRGRGEISRMLLAAGGAKFEDKRVTGEEWAVLKPKTPGGTLPILEIDGKTVISQSISIARYIAREFALDGKTNLEKAVVDQITDTLLDLFSGVLKFAFNKDEEEKAKLKKTFMEETAPKILGQLEALVKDGKNGFAVGQSLTMADLMLYAYLQGTECDKQLDKFPKLKANRETVEKQPRIKAYLANRKETPF